MKTGSIAELKNAMEFAKTAHDDVDRLRDSADTTNGRQDDDRKRTGLTQK